MSAQITILVKQRQYRKAKRYLEERGLHDYTVEHRDGESGLIRLTVDRFHAANILCELPPGAAKVA